MKRRFNTTGPCSPQRHYMVRLDDRVKKIKEDYVDYDSYFVINKGRQYGKTTTLMELFHCLSRMCTEAAKPIVLMIDEVDSAGNNQVFIDFLAQLQGYYLKRDETPVFHSVILAGGYSIKNLKL